MCDPENVLGRSNIIYAHSMGREITMFDEFLYVVLLLLFAEVVGMHLIILAQQLAHLIQTISRALGTISHTS